MLTLADLRPDATIDLTVEQLRRSAMALPNVGNDSQPFDAYRTEMLEMSRMLSNHFTWTSVDNWVFDNAYRRVFAERDRWALNHELDRRPRQLDELRLTLIAQGERWAGDETIALLDANVVLTDQNIQVAEDDWVTILNHGVRVRLTIPLLVVHEIDRLKRTGNPTTAKAARSSIRWLDPASDRYRTGTPSQTTSLWRFSTPVTHRERLMWTWRSWKVLHN